MYVSALTFQNNIWPLLNQTNCKKNIIFQLQLTWLNQTVFQFSNKQTNKHGEPLLEGEEVEVVEVPGFLVINKGLVS